jgi:hypothetical protein
LSISEGTLSPVFNPTILEYTLSVDGSVDVVTIMAETDAGILVKSGAGEQSIGYGHNILSVVATNGDYDKTYTIKVDRGLFSVCDLHGNGKRRVNIKSSVGGGSNVENPYKLLIGKNSIKGSTSNKWCPTGDGDYKEVVFVFADIYEVGAIEVRDKGTLEDLSGQFDDWDIATSLDGDDWTEAGHWTGEESIITKYHTFTPLNARYLKFTINQSGTRWIYGVDIFGKYIEPSDPEVVSRGKTILSYTGGYWEGNGRETPANILDGNLESDSWASYEDGQSVEIDLEDVYAIGGFKLTNDQQSNDNFSKYRVYTKQNLLDEWGTATEIAMPLESETVKLGVVTGEQTLLSTVTARYVKLEIPAEYKNRSTGWIRIKEFEVIKANPTTSIKPINKLTSERVIAQHYYNLQGVKVTKPQSGIIYLVKKIFESGRSEVSKIIFGKQ